MTTPDQKPVCTNTFLEADGFCTQCGKTHKVGAPAARKGKAPKRSTTRKPARRTQDTITNDDPLYDLYDLVNAAWMIN